MNTPQWPNLELNQRAARLVAPLIATDTEYRIGCERLKNGTHVVDLGVSIEGGLAAGVELARICLAGLGTVSIGEDREYSQPSVVVRTDHPVAACLFSQYAGWQIQGDGFFGMGSGPMRSLSCREELFEKLGYADSATVAVGVLEASILPEAAVADSIAEKCGVSPEELTLLVARTASQAGTVQVVARSVETALHKLFELGFDLNTVVSGYGVAPLPPVAADDLTGIGRTNDAILYGSRVNLWLRTSDDAIRSVGPQIPSTSSDSHGRSFLSLFEEAGHDFYALDPALFSPALVTLHNLTTGRTFRFGRLVPELVRASFES